MSGTPVWTTVTAALAPALLQGEQQRQRAAERGAPPDDDDVLARDVDAVVRRTSPGCPRACRHRPLLLQHELAQADGVQAVAVLVGVDGAQGGVEVELRRDRVLDEVGVDGGSALKRSTAATRSACVPSPGTSMCWLSDADPLARLVLLAHVARRRGVVAHEDGAEADGLAPLAQSAPHALATSSNTASATGAPASSCAVTCPLCRGGWRCPEAWVPPGAHTAEATGSARGHHGRGNGFHPDPPEAIGSTSGTHASSSTRRNPLPRHLSVAFRA